MTEYWTALEPIGRAQMVAANGWREAMLFHADLPAGFHLVGFALGDAAIGGRVMTSRDAPVAAPVSTEASPEAKTWRQRALEDPTFTREA